jgi:hypothetical protein
MDNIENETIKPFVFLGGTCNNTTWRNSLILKLVKNKIYFFNPVVEDWTPECKLAEDIAKKASTYELYVITPEMTGVYSIAEMVYCGCKTPKKLIICIPEDNRWESSQLKSLKASVELAQQSGAAYCDTLDDVVNYLKVAIHGTN